MIFSAVFYQVSLEVHETICICAKSFFIFKGSTSYIENINLSGSPKKNICWYETQKLPKNLNIYLHNYQTGTAIFLATKHEKTVMACSYLNFSIQKIYQNSKKWWFMWWKWLIGCFSQFLWLWWWILWCQCFWDSSED